MTSIFYSRYFMLLFISSIQLIASAQNSFDRLTLSAALQYQSAAIVERPSIIQSTSSSSMHEVDGTIGIQLLALVRMVGSERISLESGLFVSSSSYTHHIKNIRTATDPVFDISYEVHKWKVGVPLIGTLLINQADKKVLLNVQLGLVPIRTFDSLEKLAFTTEPSDQVFRNSSNAIQAFNFMLYAGLQFAFPLNEQLSIGLTPFYTQNLWKDKLYLKIEEARDFALGTALAVLINIE